MIYLTADHFAKFRASILPQATVYVDFARTIIR
jgi:hypothetical protein